MITVTLVLLGRETGACFEAFPEDNRPEAYANFAALPRPDETILLNRDGAARAFRVVEIVHSASLDDGEGTASTAVHVSARTSVSLADAAEGFIWRPKEKA